MMMHASASRRDKRNTLLRRAISMHGQGDLAAAEALCRKLIRDDPEDAEALHLCGVVRGSQGDRAQAESFIRRAVRVRPGFAAAWSNLGNILAADGRTGEAGTAYRHALAADPAFAPALHNLAKLVWSHGDVAAALDYVRRACTLQPRDAGSRMLCAEISAAGGLHAEAEAALRVAAVLAPLASEPLTNLGNLLLGVGRLDEAVTTHRAATRLQPRSAIAWYGLAAAQRAAGCALEALASIDAALAVEPGHAETWNLKGIILRSLGRFNEAISSLERALVLQPEYAPAIRHIAISRSARDEAEIGRLRDLLLRPGLGDDEAISTGFALGKTLDDLDRPNEAFGAFSDANVRMLQRLRHAGRAYDPEAFEAAAAAARTIAQPGAAVSDSELPVLVVGMPRSGTSLVEQILASHPQVFGAGELVDLSRLRAGGAELACAYVDGLRRRAPLALRVVDKMPDNLLLLAAIAPVLPKARVLVCRRDPRDTALSCYMTRFAAGNAFSYDLWSCGHRTGVTAGLADWLLEKLPLRILSVDYEAMVQNVEREARRMISFVGLDWNDACLSFHATERSVLTASAWQVRQPIFETSVGRWRKYREHLGPLLDGLSFPHAPRDADAVS